jgi:MazG family protein
MAQPGARLPELMAIMDRLLAPDGCPWDRVQTLETLRPYVIEEAHEVVDAIDRGNMADLCEELGDLLLQIAFQSALARPHFDIDDVVGAICAKMVRRHPHVFGSESAADATAVKERWEALKAKEKAGRSVLAGVPVAMPALLRAQRVGEKAAHLGLDFPTVQSARDKVAEELAELDAEIAAGAAGATAEVEGELGDLLFAVANLGRKLGVEPESALRRTIDKFSRRVQHVEATTAAEAVAPTELSLDELDGYWRRAKEAVDAE